MIATAPTKTATTNNNAPGTRPAAKRDHAHAPDLGYFRRRYPETVASLGALARREEWLRRIWEQDERWLKASETRGGRHAEEEVVVRGAPPAGGAREGEFDVIYAGGATALLHAAVLASRYGRRVLLLGGGAGARRATAGWSVSDEELTEFERAGLFTREEVERAVVNRCRGGLVKFHDAGSRVKAEPLWVRGVFDVAIEAERLLALAAEKVRAARGCALVEGARFVRAYVEPSGVTVEAEGPNGARRFFRARLFVEAGGADSPVARQLGGGRAATHVCPTVGTVARGFVKGEGRDSVDFGVNEILVSTEDAGDHRQLLWGGCPGDAARGEYATCLFFYDAVDSPADKSLLSLFERYFESLPAYKRRGAQWRVERPLFGHAPGAARRGWRAKAAADDRVLSLGGAASPSSPLALRGFGAHVRGLHRLTHLTELALAADLLDAAALEEITSCEPRARASGLAEFMRPAPKGAPSSVNETLNAVMAALGGLDERVRRELFQDRLSFAALRKLLGRTARLYPRIFARVRERFGARGTLVWLAELAGAAWSERRGHGAARAGDDGAGEDPAHEFARHAALYRNEGGAGV
jgi:lycopene cyclase CruA